MAVEGIGSFENPEREARRAELAWRAERARRAEREKVERERHEAARERRAEQERLRAEREAERERLEAERAAERERVAKLEQIEAERRAAEEAEKREKEEAKSVVDLLLDWLRGGPEEPRPEAPEKRAFGERAEEFFTESFKNTMEKLAFRMADVVVPGAGQALENAKKVVWLAESVDQYFRKRGSVKLALPIVVNRETGFGIDLTAQLDDGQVEEVGGELDLFAPAGIGSETPEIEPVEEEESPEEADSSGDGAGETDGGPGGFRAKSAEPVEEEGRPQSVEGPVDEPRPAERHGPSAPSDDTRLAATDHSPSVPSDDSRPAPSDHGPEGRPEHRPEREFTLRRFGGSPVVTGGAGPSPALQLVSPDDEPAICALIGDPVFFGTRFVDAVLIMEYARLRVFEEQRQAHPPIALVRAMNAAAALRTVLFLDPESGLCLVVHVDGPGGEAYSPLLLRFEDPTESLNEGPFFASRSR